MWKHLLPLQWHHNERDGVSNHHRSKKISKLRVTGLCEVTGGFPWQRARNPENVSYWWRHHATKNSRSLAVYILQYADSRWPIAGWSPSWARHGMSWEFKMHDDVIKWKHFPRNWPFVRGMHRSRWIPAQRPVTRGFDVFFDLHLIKRLSKHSPCWWFETLSRPLWRHCNGTPEFIFVCVAPYVRMCYNGSLYIELVWKLMVFVVELEVKGNSLTYSLIFLLICLSLILA